MFLRRKKSVVAKMVGSTLVASFQNANPPLIWKFDLQRNHSFTLVLQGEDGDWELGLNSPRGDFYPIVHFYAREDADEAFVKVQKILMKKRSSPGWRFVKWTLGILLTGFVLFMTYGFLLNFMGYTPEGIMSSGFTQPKVPSTNSPKVPMGVPVPADQLLQRPD